MYESVKRKGATSPTVLPQWAVPTPVESLPKSTEVVQRALTAHTFRPVPVQRRATQPVLQASQYEQREVQRSATEQATVQRQLDVLPPLLPGALSAALQRQQAPARPPFKPQSPAEWVAVMRFQAEQAEGRLMDVYQAGQFTALQRQVAQVLQQGYRQDRQPPAVRQAQYAEHLVALQRHPTSSQVARAVMALMPAGERPSLQRAVDEALQRQAVQDAQDQAALTQQTLQRKKAELEAEAVQPVLQRIQARRGAGNPLPAAIQRHLEQGLNHDLSRVRIHDDAEADKLSKKVNALAFTTGTDIYFRSGQFNPNTQSGLELLAHEVTHTVQQSKGNVGTGVDPDAGLESEARQMGQKLATLPVKQAPNPHAPGVYTHAAALTRVQAGAAQALSLKPLTDLQPQAVQRLGNPLTWVADQAKSGLASALTAIPGYRELTMAFGKDLVTGKTMAANPNAILDALAGWVPGPLKDVLKALKETGAIPKAWTWFKAELSKLNLGGALGEVGKAMGKADLGAAKTAITRRISGLKALIVGSAHKIAEIGLMALTAGLGPVGQQVIAKLRGSGDLILQVLRNPAKFASHLLGALKGGFSRFAQNAPKHLQNGLGQWLTGASGIAFPAKLDLQGVFLTALSVMGLTYQAMRGRLVKSLGANGEKQVRQAEGTLDTLKTLKGGLHKATEMKANQGSVSSEVTSNLKTEVTKSVVMAGITKVATMLIPGGGFVNALIGAFRSVQFLVQQGQQIMGVVTSAIASVSAIAAGNIGAAITGVESTLARSIPVALGFLGKLLGLGNMGAKIKAVINKVRGKLDRLLDKVVARIKALVVKTTGAARSAGRTVATGAQNVAARTRALVTGLFGRKSFRGGGEQHSVWAEIKPNNVQLMIASTPKEASEQLLFFAQQARASLGADPRQVFNKSIQPHLAYALGQVKLEKQALLTATTTLPVSEREAKIEMGVRASNITARVAQHAQKLLDEINLHAGGTHTMAPVTLTFNRVPTSRGATRRYDQQELALQLAEQENALKRMTVAEWLRRYPHYPGATRTARKVVHGSDKKARDDYRNRRAAELLADLLPRLRRQYLAEGMSRSDAADKADLEAERRVTAFMTTQAALHMPDKIAGGDYLLDIDALGDTDVNSFLGSQWNSDKKIDKLKTACDAVPNSHRASSFLNVQLVLR